MSDVELLSPLVDPDDALEWTEEQLARAEFAEGEKVIRPAQGTLMHDALEEYLVTHSIP